MRTNREGMGLAPKGESMMRQFIQSQAWVPLVQAMACISALLIFLPERWLPVDAPLLVWALLSSVVCVGLVCRRSWSRPLARLLAAMGLVLGATAVTLLVWSCAYLWGIYGPVGKGGTLIMAAVALLVLPYFVILPAWQLWLFREAKPA